MNSSENYPKAYLYRRIVQAKFYIDDHFSEPIHLNDMADTAAFSRFHFFRLFKQAYQKTPHQYLTFVRIEYAKRLMMHGNLSIADVCMQSGFESGSSFSSLFKKYTGTSPIAYRLQLQTKISASKKTPLKFVPSCFAEKNGWLKKSNFEEAIP
jgi:AraC-like DNA-binding protein